MTNVTDFPKKKEQKSLQGYAQELDIETAKIKFIIKSIF